jgi:hypothetical protein
MTRTTKMIRWITDEYIQNDDCPFIEDIAVFDSDDVDEWLCIIEVLLAKAQGITETYE